MEMLCGDSWDANSSTAEIPGAKDSISEVLVGTAAPGVAKMHQEASPGSESTEATKFEAEAAESSTKLYPGDEAQSETTKFKPVAVEPLSDASESTKFDPEAVEPASEQSEVDGSDQEAVEMPSEATEIGSDVSETKNIDESASIDLEVASDPSEAKKIEEPAKNTSSKRFYLKNTCASSWIPRVKVESYLERKIRMLQEEQGVKASLDETLGSSSRHLSRIEREKQAAVAAARDATETRKAALMQASWCRILKAAGIPYMAAAVELQKAEKVASDAFKKAVALGVLLRTAGSRSVASTSKHKITASLDTAFEVDEEVATAVKSALQRITGDEPLPLKEITAASENGQRDDDGNGSKPRDALTALMLERLKSLEPEQRSSLSSIVETRGLNALLREERYEQELGARNGRGGLGDVLVKHISRLEAEKAAAETKNKESDGSMASSRSRKNRHDNDAWGGLDFGSSLKRHVSKLEAEQAAWRRAEDEARSKIAA